MSINSFGERCDGWWGTPHSGISLSPALRCFPRPPRPSLPCPPAGTSAVVVGKAFVRVCLASSPHPLSLTLENVRSDLLHKYQSKDDILVLTVRVAVIVAVILTVPVLFFTVSEASVSSEERGGLTFPSVSGARCSRQSPSQVAFLCH